MTRDTSRPYRGPLYPTSFVQPRRLNQYGAGRRKGSLPSPLLSRRVRYAVADPAANLPCRLVGHGMSGRAGNQVAEREHVQDAAEVGPVAGEGQVGWLVLGESSAEAVGEACGVVAAEPRHVAEVRVRRPGKTELPVQDRVHPPAGAHSGDQDV